MQHRGVQSKRLVGYDQDGGGASPPVLSHEARETLVDLLLGARVDGEGVDPASEPLRYLLMPVLLWDIYSSGGMFVMVNVYMYYYHIP